MDIMRIRQIYQLVEACHHTDNSDLDSEKTAVIEELLMEVDRTEGESNCGGGRKVG